MLQSFCQHWIRVELRLPEDGGCPQGASRSTICIEGQQTGAACKKFRQRTQQQKCIQKEKLRFVSSKTLSTSSFGHYQVSGHFLALMRMVVALNELGEMFV